MNNINLIKLLEKAVEHAPDNIYMHINLTNAYQSLGEMKKALHQWQEVLRMSSTDKKYENLTNQAINQIIKIKAYLYKRKQKRY